MTTLTNNEFSVLHAIDTSEYGEYLQDDVWTWSAADYAEPAGKAFSGTVSSLVKKGLVTSIEDGEDSSIGMTDSGVDAYLKAAAERGVTVNKRDMNEVQS